MAHSLAWDRSQIMRAMHTIQSREQACPTDPRPEGWEEFQAAIAEAWPGRKWEVKDCLARYWPVVAPGTQLADYTRLPQDPSFDAFRGLAEPLISAGWVKGFIWPPWSKLAWVHRAELQRELGDLVAAWRSSILLGGPQ